MRIDLQSVPRPHARSPLVVVTASLLLASLSSFAANPPNNDDFAEKSIEELMNVDVTSVARKEQKLSKAPAAVYVITRDAIERSGATIIPDLLRIVPGVQVAQVESNRWAISVRGFNGIYSNKLLVLVDGRTIYTPTFSGVYWDQLNIPLETIERIEVIRGAGAATWGANAVNGVINIITRQSSDTQGLSVSAGAGSHQTGDYNAIYAAKLRDSIAYRAFGAYSSFGSYRSSVDGSIAHDNWHSESGGIRADIHAGTKDALLVETDLIQTSGHSLVKSLQPVLSTAGLPLDNIRGNFMARWTHKHSDTSESSLQVSDSDYTRHDVEFSEHVNTVDVDFENHSQLGSRNDVVWGGAVRATSDNVRDVLNQPQSFKLWQGFIQILPSSDRYNLVSGFVQDELSFGSNVSITLGSKLEHYTFSGFDLEPSGRFAWTPTAKSTIWLAASRAARLPSRVDRDVFVTFPVHPITPNFGITEQLSGNKKFLSEYVRDFETGYRIVPASRVSFDVTGFYSLYNNLTETPLALPQISSPAPQQLLITLPIITVNRPGARNSGAEAVVTWNAAAHWKLTGTYSYLHTAFYNTDMSHYYEAATQKLSTILPVSIVGAFLVQSQGANLGSDAQATAPNHQSGIQSFLDLNKRTSFDTSLYYVGGIGSVVKPYERLDQRIAYKIRPNIEASVVGQNLLTPDHVEIVSAEEVIPTRIERSVFANVKFRF